MGVNGVGVDRLSVAVDNVSVDKSVAIVGVDNTFRRRPVCLAMLQFIGISMVVVGEVVKTDVYLIAVVHVDDWHRKPVVAGCHLQRSYVTGQYDIPLG